MMAYLMFVVVLLLLALIVFLLLSFRIERNGLLDRIMAKDYKEFQMFDAPTPKVLESHSSMSDEEEVRMELENKGVL